MAVYLRQLARPCRIDRLAHKYARRAARLREIRGNVKKPFARKARGSRAKTIIAYDFETTPVKVGTPQLRYVTAYGDGYELSGPAGSIEELAAILLEYFLTDDTAGVRFVGWNSNHYDAYFVGQALLLLDGYVIRPYLTRSKTLRGLKVIRTADGKSWEFLDGLSMTGLDSKFATTTDKEKMGSSLRDFLKVFAPDYQKLDAPDWDKEEFDADNPDHVKYAERDSEGLYRGLMRAQEILKENFQVSFQPTMGNTAIKIFQANMPAGINVWETNVRETQIIREFVMRGGYCHCVRRYEGPIWKYDVNQAYAAAMRDADLPAGRLFHSKHYTDKGKPALIRLSATNSNNIVPFYYRDADLKTRFGVTKIEDSWLTSSEYEQLSDEGWSIDVRECYVWEDAFRMREYVDRLEKLRMEAPDGPNGALGLIVKQIGNSSYGKTCEQLDGIELVLSKKCPDGFKHYQSDEDQLQYVWCRLVDPQFRDYHRPQLGAFITAHVRMVVRRAILCAPTHWIYADTDCVCFDSPVDLPLDAKRYGFWKVEVNGELYRIIRKKVYASHETRFDDKLRADVPVVGHAKGMNVKRLTENDFKAWAGGLAPQQTQLQRVNFIKAMTGSPMFGERTKVGEIVTTLSKARDPP